MERNIFLLKKLIGTFNIPSHGYNLQSQNVCTCLYCINNDNESGDDNDRRCMNYTKRIDRVLLRDRENRQALAMARKTKSMDVRKVLSVHSCKLY